VREKLTRRELASIFGLGAVASGLQSSYAGGPAAHPGVVGVAELGRDTAADSSAAARALEAALQAAVPGSSSATAAASALFAADDIVGIKLNCLAGKPLSPRRGLVEALVELVAAAGVARNKIIVFERSSRELARAGFELRRSGGPYLCYGTDNDYDRVPSTSGSIGSCYARLVSTTCTALVSFGVVKDHDLAGVSAGLKNWYGVIHNPNKYHDKNCDPYVADVVRHPFVAKKLRLTVLDGVRGQCQGGPAFLAEGLFDLGRVAVSTDPVAADLWAWQVIEAERARRGLLTLEAEERPPRFLETAARYGLGVGETKDLLEVKA